MQFGHPIFRRQKKRAVVIVQIGLRAETDLAKVVHVLCDFAALLHPIDGWEKQPNERDDDGHDHEHLDQREACAFLFHQSGYTVLIYTAYKSENRPRDFRQIGSDLPSPGASRPPLP